jgi:hypothetical protein
MAGEGWGLNAWFNDEEKSEGHIVKLKMELEGRLNGKGTAAYKKTPISQHADNVIFFIREATEFLKGQSLTEDEIGLYIRYFSTPQRERDEKGWKSNEVKWKKVDEKVDDMDVVRRVRSAIDSANKSWKQLPEKVITEEDVLGLLDGSVDAFDSEDSYGRSLDWVKEMIDKCDEMIEIINRKDVDATFRENTLRNR